MRESIRSQVTMCLRQSSCALITLGLITGATGALGQQVDTSSDRRSSQLSSRNAQEITSVLFSTISLGQANSIQAFQLEKTGDRFGDLDIGTYSFPFAYPIPLDSNDRRLIVGAGFNFTSLNQEFDYRDPSVTGMSYDGTENREYKIYTGELLIMLEQKLGKNVIVFPGLAFSAAYLDGEYEDIYQYPGFTGPYAVISDDFWLVRGTALLGAEVRFPFDETERFGVRVVGRGDYSHTATLNRDGVIEQTAFENDLLVSRFATEQFGNFSFDTFRVRYGVGIWGPSGLEVQSIPLEWEVFAIDNRIFGDVSYFNSYQEFGLAIGFGTSAYETLRSLGLEEIKIGASYVRGEDLQGFGVNLGLTLF